MTREEIKSLLKAKAKRPIDIDLMTAIILTESSGNPDRVCFEPHIHSFTKAPLFAKKFGMDQKTEENLQMMSWGLCQLMGNTARDIGYEGNLLKLLDPEINVIWGMEFFWRKSRRYEDKSDLIASYNAGTPMMVGAVYKNQDYVNKVLSNLT